LRRAGLRLRLFQSRFIILSLACGNVDLGLKIGRIDLEKQISLTQLLIIMDRDANDRPRYPRGYTNDIRSDLAISRPGMLNVSEIERDSRPERQANNDQRD
jgi:hypothetical protein